MRRSQKSKKLLQLTVFFALLGSACIKAACKMLVKLTFGVQNQRRSHIFQNNCYKIKSFWVSKKHLLPIQMIPRVVLLALWRTNILRDLLLQPCLHLVLDLLCFLHFWPDLSILSNGKSKNHFQPAKFLTIALVRSLLLRLMKFKYSEICVQWPPLGLQNCGNY